MMSISLRFIPTLIEETDKIMKAQMARGVDFANGPVKERVKAIVPLLVPLLSVPLKELKSLQPRWRREDTGEEKAVQNTGS